MTHTHFQDTTRQTIARLWLSLALTAVFVIIELGAGWVANSLVLLTDAAHNFTDVVALALTGGALRLTVQPANSGKTFGYHRAGILAALVNSTLLALIALGIFYEAYRRLVSPPQVTTSILIGVGAVGVGINVLTAWLVERGSRGDLNVRTAFLHLLGDVASSLGAVLAGVMIRLTGLNWIDPLVSLLIGLLILWNAWTIVRASLNILMESTPADIDVEAMVKDIRTVPGVRGVHDLHVWSLTLSLRTLSAHLVTDDVPISVGAKIQEEVSRVLNDKYGINHATLQLECVDCVPADLYCDITLSSSSKSR
jgi:cobalt-zinc-cadmium efflux system protein